MTAAKQKVIELLQQLESIHQCPGYADEQDIQVQSQRIELGEHILTLDPDCLVAPLVPVYVITDRWFRGRAYFFKRGSGLAANKGKRQYYTKRAIEDFTRVIELSSQYDEKYPSLSYQWRCVCYLELRMFHEAILDATELVDRNPENWDYYDLRSQCYREAGNYEQAIADTTYAIELTPDDGITPEYAKTKTRVYRTRGLAYEAKGDDASAQHDFEHAEEWKMQEAARRKNWR